ncbi:MAG: hypothetical protein U0263_15745 [Polyangiaceae bacterium]
MLVHQMETASAGQPFGAFIEDIMAKTVASVMSSMAALEAYVNEVTFEPVTARGSRRGSLQTSRK